MLMMKSSPEEPSQMLTKLAIKMPMSAMPSRLPKRVKSVEVV